MSSSDSNLSAAFFDDAMPSSPLALEIIFLQDSISEVFLRLFHYEELPDCRNQ